MISRITSIKRHQTAPEIPISIKQSFIIGEVISFCGNDGIWKMCQCTKVDSGQSCTIQIYEKRGNEKIYKSKRKEYISEILRREIECLHEFRHNYVLQLFTTAHENGDYLMFVCEPLICSLANLIDERESLPEYSTNDFKTRKLVTLEILLGFYQMVEALRHLHVTHGIIHGNLSPNNILIGTHNHWKLTGLGFCIKLSEKAKSHNYCWSSKQVKSAQPDLNYIAPEIQLKNIPIFQSDIFSLGLVICSIYNNGCSLIECSKNLSTYVKKVDELRSNFLKIYSKLPNSIADTVQQMLNRIPTERPDIEELREMDCFKDSLILSLDSLFSLDGKSMNERKDFFNLFSKLVADYPEELQYQRILPILMNWFRFSSNLTMFVLPSILTMIYKATKADFDKHLYFNLQFILNSEIGIQTVYVLLDLVEFYIDRLQPSEVLAKILPLFLRILEDPAITESQANNIDLLWNCLSVLQNILTPTQLKEHILSKLKIIFNKENQIVKTQILCLECLDQLLEDVDSKTLTEDVISFLTSVSHSDTSIYLAVLGIYKHMILSRSSDISFKLIAKRILPPLIPHAVNPNLKAEEFILVMHVLRKLLDKIERDRCNQLNIESVRSNSGSLSSIGSNINCNRVLPLISMQQPTVEIDYGSQNSFNSSRMTGSRRGSNVSDYRRGSTDNNVGSRRNSALMNRLKLNNSESLLFPTRNRRGSGFDNRNWSKTSSNPAFISQLSGDNSRENIQLSSNSMNYRRLSGNANPYINKGLAVPNNNQFPRRHSYESSHNASINSLITASVCEGPFISPSSSRIQSRRTSAQSLGPQILPGNNARRMSSTGPRRLSFNAFSDTLINLFQ